MNIINKTTTHDKTFFPLSKNQHLFISDPDIESKKIRTDSGYVYIDSDDIYFVETKKEIPITFFVKNKILYSSVSDDLVSFNREFLGPNNLDEIDRFTRENKIKNHNIIFNMINIPLDGNEHLLTYDPTIENEVEWDGKKKEYYDVKINMDLDYPISFFVRNSIYRGDVENRFIIFPVSYIKYNNERYPK